VTSLCSDCDPFNLQRDALTRLGLEPWLSALIVALATMAMGYLLVNAGLNRMRRISAPRQTIETLKETASWTTRQGA